MTSADDPTQPASQPATQPMMSFTEASRVEQRGEDRFACNVPEGWRQGRGAYGGLGIGIAVRAMEALETERPLRALTAELPGPLLPGGAEIETRTLHRGSGVTTVEATVLQEGVKVRASGVFGKTRMQDPRWAPEPPALGDWREVEPMPMHDVGGPNFAKHFEYRCTGPMPGSGSEPLCEGWVRPVTPMPRWGAAEVVALADVYWPASLAAESSLRPMATVTYALQLMDVAQRLPTDAPLFHRARVLGGDDGYVAEMRELWTEHGELVALNPQTFVIIK